MDFVTHAAVGALVGRALTVPDPDRREGARFAAAGALAASLPDADHVLEWIGADAYLLHHRSVTHSLLFASLVVALVAAMVGTGPGRSRRALVVTAALGSHLFLDLLTPFGTGILWPLSDLRPSFDVLPIVAPWLVALSVSGLAWATWRARRGGAAGRRASRIALAGLALFLAAHAGVAWRAGAVVPAGGEVLALPDPNLPWRAVAFVAGDDDIRQYAVALDGTVTETNRTPRIRGAPDERERVHEIMRAAHVRPFLARYRLPVARVDGDVVVLEDAQYDHVSRDVEPAWVVVPLGAGAAREPRAHLVVTGVQPLVWGGVVLVAWGSGRRWRRRRIGPKERDEADAEAA